MKKTEETANPVYAKVWVALKEITKYDFSIKKKQNVFAFMFRERPHKRGVNNQLLCRSISGHKCCPQPRVDPQTI